MTKKKGFVHIIESPSSLDLLNDQTEGKSLCASFKLSNIPHCYNLVTNEESFEKALSSRLSKAWKRFDNTPPFLHLSMHGDSNGIELTNGKEYSWADLHTSLSPLIKAMDGNLIITMSTCHGAAGCKMAFQSLHGPTFLAIVGNTEETDWDDAAIAYTVFYHNLMKGKSLNDCVIAMQMASGDKNFLTLEGNSLQKSVVEHFHKLLKDGPPEPTPLPKNT